MYPKRFLHIIICLKKIFLGLVFWLQATVLFAQYGEKNDSVKIDTTYTSIATGVPHQFDELRLGDSVFYEPHSLADSLVERLKNEDEFWYANKSMEPKKKKQEQISFDRREPFYLKQWFRSLVWFLIIAGFVTVLIWFLIASDVRFFRKKPSVIYSVSDDVLPDDIFSIDYENELDQSLAGKNLRLSVRLMYLHTLRLLAARELIDYKIEKTNSDYLAQLYSTGYYKDFFQLTRHFEYVWYGKFDLSEAAFESIKQEYQTLKSRLRL